MQQLTVDDLVYLGVRGTVVAVNRHTGQDVWRTTLKGYDFVNLVIDAENLFATARGEIYCLDRATGHVKWMNPLRGMGYGLICIATPTSQQGLFVESHHRAQQAASAANSTPGVT